MSFKNSPLFHFMIGTLWFITAAVTAYETKAFLGSVYWPPVLFGAAGICFYARCIYLIIKRQS